MSDNFAALRSLFYPKSLALIGASTQEGSVGNEIAKNLVQQGYAGKLFLVNPKGGDLFGQKMVTDLAQITTDIDLAVIAIPAKFVIEEIKLLLKHNLKAVVVISAGFREVGNLDMEVEMAKLCEDHGVVLVGPNCLGFINSEVKLNASFAPIMPTVGNVAFVSQSGAICASVLDYARERGIGFSKFVSAGNKALMGEVEFLEYLYHDPKTKVIALYVEQLRESQRLRQVARRITHGNPHKPIIILKSGRSAAGQKAAMSHTGSLGSSDLAYEALFAQTGIIRAESIDELFDFVECFDRNHELKDNRVAVITNAGGPGVLTTDALEDSGMELAQLSEATQTRLKSFLPASASIKNPVDILGDANADRYHQAVNAVLSDPNVDAIQVILTPQSMTEVEATARAIVAAKRHSAKPVIVSFIGQDLVEPGLEVLNEHKIATTAFPEPGSHALGALYKFRQWLRPKSGQPEKFPGIDKAKARAVLDTYLTGKIDQKPTLLPIEAAFAILAAYKFPITKRWVLSSATEAEQLQPSLKGLLAIKVMSPQINHKSDVGGVMLDVHPSDLAESFTKMKQHIAKIKPAAQFKGIEVMPMIDDEGVEIILGATTDPQLGKQILVGLGGIYAEALQDVAWGLAPLAAADIVRMIDNLKTAKILAGLRGHGPLAVDVLEECMGRLSELVTDFPEIQEIDINPLKVLDAKKGAVVLDCRMVIQHS